MVAEDMVMLLERANVILSVESTMTAAVIILHTAQVRRQFRRMVEGRI